MGGSDAGSDPGVRAAVITRLAVAAVFDVFFLLGFWMVIRLVAGLLRGLRCGCSWPAGVRLGPGIAHSSSCARCASRAAVCTSMGGGGPPGPVGGCVATGF